MVQLSQERFDLLRQVAREHWMSLRPGLDLVGLCELRRAGLVFLSERDGAWGHVLTSRGQDALQGIPAKRRRKVRRRLVGQVAVLCFGVPVSR